MSRFRRSSRRKASFSGRKPVRRPSRRYSATSGKFKRTGKGKYKRRATGTFKRSAGAAAAGGSSTGFKMSTGLIALLAVGGGIYWMSQKRASAQAAAQMAAAQAAAARTSSGAPFPTAATAMAPAATANPAATILGPIMDLFKPIAPNSPVPG